MRSGFGVAFLSMHTCVLELDAGRLKVLPLADNPLQRDWYVIHLAARQLPQVALAFEQFLRLEGQGQIQAQLAQHAVFSAPKAVRRSPQGGRRLKPQPGTTGCSTASPRAAAATSAWAGSKCRGTLMA